jgi:hypothetical protein
MFVISSSQFDLRICRIIYNCKLFFGFVLRIKSDVISLFVAPFAESVPVIAFNSYHVSDLKFHFIATLRLG